MYLGCHLHFPCVRVPLLSRWKDFPEMIWQLVHYQNLFTSSTSKRSKQCGYNSFLTKRCVEPGETYHIQFSNWDPDGPMMPQAKQRKKNSVIPYQEKSFVSYFVSPRSIPWTYLCIGNHQCTPYMSQTNQTLPWHTLGCTMHPGTHHSTCIIERCKINVFHSPKAHKQKHEEY